MTMAIAPIETDDSTAANSNSNSNSNNSSATSSAAGGSNNNARIIRRRGGGGGGANSNNNSNANNNNNNNNTNMNTPTPTPNTRQYVRPSLADFQDGKRFSAAENTSILNDTIGVFQNISTRLLHQSSPNKNANHRHRHRHGGKIADNERTMNDVRFGVGLYQNFPLANAILAGSYKRERALKKSGHKQMNHVRGTDGWWRSMLVIEDRAIDTYLGPWIVVCLNALLACILTEVVGVKMPEETLQHWDTVSSDYILYMYIVYMYICIRQ